MGGDTNLVRSATRCPASPPLPLTGDYLFDSLALQELQDMIDQADRDGDGEINPDEFYRIMKKRGDNPLDDLLDDDDD